MSGLKKETRSKRTARRKLVRWIRRIVLAVAGVAALGGLVYAFLPKPVPIDEASVTRGPLAVYVEEDGKTRVKYRYVLSTPVGGNVMRIDLEPGDAVSENEVVARVMPTRSPLLDARARAEAEARVAAATAARRRAASQLSVARAALDHAEEVAERQRLLWESRATSKESLDAAEFEARARGEEVRAAKFAVRVADHEVEMAQATLSGEAGKDAAGQIEIRAPVKGRVLQRFQESEAVVPAGTQLLELGDPWALEVVVDVLTRDAVEMKVGAPVIIDRWGGPEPLTGHVRVIEPSAFTRISALGVEEQRVNVIIEFDGDRARHARLGDGFRVEVKIEMWRAGDVLSVPASAVFRHVESWAVYQVVDGEARLRDIEIDRRNESRVQIVSGLSDGDVVVLHPSDSIRQGVSVVPR